MHKTIRKLTIAAAAAIPAVAILAGSAGAVSQYSKVANGDFSNGTAGWTAAASPLAQITAPSNHGYVANAFDGVAASKTFAYQCFAVTGGLKYELAGKIYIPHNQKRSGAANLGIVFYSGNDCTTQVGAAYTLPVTGLGSWKAQSITPTAPGSAKSAMVRLGVEKKAPLFLQSPSAKFGAYFDDIEVLQKSIKLPDGPIIQNPTATPTPKGPIIKIPIPTTTPTPPVDDLPVDDPEQDPTPDPQPQPDPEQPDQPDQEQPDQPDQEQPEQDPDQPQDEPAPSDDETTETDVPGPDLPAPDTDDDQDETPPSGGSGSGSGGSANDTDDPQGSAANGTGSDVQTLGGAGEPSTSNSPDSPSGPTPAAPNTGNAGDSDGLIGGTGLAVGGGLALAGLGLAVVAFARSRRKDEDDELYGE
jgi:hypothetical protein